jgi:aldehyde dehydrogenase (NAD+)
VTWSKELLTSELLIGGDLLKDASGGTIEHVYPATADVNGLVTLGGKSEINQAVGSALAAAKIWGDMVPAERRDRLGRLAEIVEAWKEDFAMLAAAEIGMPRKAFAGRHRFALDWIRTYQGWADKVGGDITAASSSERLEYTRLEPYGVIGIILTWNSALLSLTMKIPAALAAGNAVVVKPSEFTPYTPILFGKACLEAGIPAGVVNIIPGGVEAGEALVAHRDVDKISFTGGVKAASAMMRMGAPLIKPFCFELGGKSAHIVFADADLELAAQIICAGLSNAGQSCTFGSRIFVHNGVYEEFRKILVSTVEGVAVGDPLDEETFMGPLFSSAARDRVLSMIESGSSNGSGRILTGGKAVRLEAPFHRGYFVQPTVFDDVNPSSALATEEIFGPVMSIFRFDTEDEVVSSVNDTDFGLSNYVHTHDLRRAIRVTSLVKSGTVYVNDATRQNVSAPFGGFRKSGFGYEGGRPGLEEYLRRKTVGLA